MHRMFLALDVIHLSTQKYSLLEMNNSSSHSLAVLWASSRDGFYIQK